MIVSLIAAVAENRVIGKNNDLVWHLPADMQYFKETTIGHPVIMGRKNFNSIPEKYRPLIDRTNIIVTHDPSFEAEGCITANSIEKAIETASALDNEEIFIIGGGQIYDYVIANQLCTKLYITEIKHSFEGDTFFPEIDGNDWNEISRISRQPDDKNDFNFDFVVYRYNR